MHPKYKAPFGITNQHTATIIPNLFRKVPKIPYVRERFETQDGDFLDLDWHQRDHSKLIILSHGLEGDSNAVYIRGMIKAFEDEDFDFLAWNNRGCSGEVNLKPHYYHSGVSHDLEEIVHHALEKYPYKEIYLIGFSMGGNITLKYLGEKPDEIPSQVKKAIAYSTPIDLKNCAEMLDKGISKLYTGNFLTTLKKKVGLKKHMMMRAGIDFDAVKKARNFKQWDDAVTAPLNGFEDAEDYWRKVSSKQFLPNIKIPTLLVNAKNDPFLGETCYPKHDELKNSNIHLNYPEGGGHVGFFSISKDGTYWSEKLAKKFFEVI